MKSQQTPLYRECLNSNARMVNFAGWDMPIQFSSVLKEHHAVRESVGVFDISHMGVVELKGINAKDNLQRLVPTDLHRIGKGEACYTVLLNNSGKILDDLIIYDLGQNNDSTESLLLVINAGCSSKDINWLRQNLQKEQISITDEKQNNVLIALQGPLAENHLQRLTNESLKGLPKFGHRYIDLNELKVESSTKAFISRTGYTGEDGFEILINSKAGQHLWKHLINEGVTPCGLGARDTLRLEAGMHLYGKDITLENTPLEAGLGWLVHLEMPYKFLGRSALEEQTEKGIKNRLVGIELEGRAIARSGYPITFNGEHLGVITSGSWAPTLNKAIAMGYISTKFAKIGNAIEIEIRGEKYPATIVKLPFYRRK